MAWKTPIVWDEMRYATYPDWTVRCDPDYWQNRLGGDAVRYWANHWNAIDNDTETYATGYVLPSGSGNYLYLYPTIQVASECEQISPDATGDYILGGTYNNKPYYQRKDGAFFIFWDGSKWFVSAELGNSETIPHWEDYGLDSRRILDVYEYDEGANGNLIVIPGKFILSDKFRYYMGEDAGAYDGIAICVETTSGWVEFYDNYPFEAGWNELLLKDFLGKATFIRGIRFKFVSGGSGGTARNLHEVQYSQIRGQVIITQ